MKTTVNIPDELMREVKRCAAERSTTVTELVRQGLYAVLDAAPALARIPTAPLGEPLIDLDDRNQLWDANFE